MAGIAAQKFCLKRLLSLFLLLVFSLEDIKGLFLGLGQLLWVFLIAPETDVVVAFPAAKGPKLLAVGLGAEIAAAVLVRVRVGRLVGQAVFVRAEEFGRWLHYSL